MAGVYKFSGLFLLLLVLVSGCKTPVKDPDKYKLYKGPLIENTNVLTLYSDSARLKVKLTAPVQQEFEGGNSVFPKGLFISFYEPSGRVQTTLKANYGTYSKEKDNYFVRGDVVVENVSKKEKLNT
ncbi:MAG: LPS export ABC transporter periplasmic protein LptC, partial [Hymenobacteraceae bacterium]|nr:LPS export ABC transporter periplasmic protein LptC [Hymenobacteraceae bacterium]MDX5398054.1 LPS export ABC transporter periplasmic protein LptC [Hymenobacteraceae bacterium]MDX5443603.1 LPS export ABC transporter periplasmic protein LptC [Hymenobacteraceae bacterium]MDX5514125.1 LPS export ABC transporter periplasmic protein LptC [Hymenobacteraceae bacterium]